MMMQRTANENAVKYKVILFYPKLYSTFPSWLQMVNGYLNSILKGIDLLDAPNQTNPGICCRGTAKLTNLKYE